MQKISKKTLAYQPQLTFKLKFYNMSSYFYNVRTILWNKSVVRFTLRKIDGDI